MTKPKSKERILAQDVYVSNDTRKTGLNDNDMIIGPTGSGKTRGYVKPNIMQSCESMVIADTKGNLIKEMGPVLKNKGYRVLEIDFKTMKSTIRWNPLDCISFDKTTDAYSEKDIMEIAEALVPDSDCRDPFWYDSARQYASLLISYVMDFLPEEEHSLAFVHELFRLLNTDTFGVLMQETRTYYPDSTAAKIWESIRSNKEAEKMHSSIVGILSSYLHRVVLKPALAMYSHTNEFRFHELGDKKTALFVDISDTDRSLDALIGLFYNQALHELCDYADQKCDKQRLPVPVRFILDDFATNIKISDFDKIISVIRSREIRVSVIIQSITQLSALYGSERAATILDNCDHVLYLGGQSLETAQYVAARANLPENEILDQPLDEAYLFTRGQSPRKVKKYDITTHGNYHELPEATGGEACLEE